MSEKSWNISIFDLAASQSLCASLQLSCKLIPSNLDKELCEGKKKPFSVVLSITVWHLWFFRSFLFRSVFVFIGYLQKVGPRNYQLTIQSSREWPGRCIKINTWMKFFSTTWHFRVKSHCKFKAFACRQLF